MSQLVNKKLSREIARAVEFLVQSRFSMDHNKEATTSIQDQTVVLWSVFYV